MLLCLYVYTILCLYYAGLTRVGQILVASWPCGVYMVEARLSASLLDGKNILRIVGHMIGDPPIWMESNWNGECKAHSNQAGEASVKVATSHLLRAKRGRGRVRA